MLRSGCRLHVVVTRVLPYLCRTISGSRGVRPLSLSSSSDSSSGGESSSSDTEEGEENVSQNHVLRAYLRNRRARCVARVREQGLVPAVLIDGDKEHRPKDGSTDVFLSLDARPLVGLLKLLGKRDFISRVFDMNIYRSSQSSDIQESLQVLPRNLNYGPGKTNILNVQLVRATPGQSLKLGVPLEYLGAEQCPGLKKGGTLKKLAKYVVYNCKATELPAKIVVDMTVLEIGDRVQVQDLEVDFDLLHSDRTMPVCEIVKDVSTLKAKAKRLKNELYFKKKALAEKEGRIQSRSLSDDEVDVSFREDEQVSRRFQRQRGAMKESADMKSISRVSSSTKRGKTSDQRLCSLSDDEVDVSDDEDDEVSTRFRRQRDARTDMNSISRVSSSTKRGKPSDQRLSSLSDDEVDVSDDEDEEVSTRFQRQRDARTKLSFKNSIKKGKTSDRRLCLSSDDEVDVSDDEDEEVSTRFRRQKDARAELPFKNFISRVAGPMKKGRVSEQKFRPLSDDEGDANINRRVSGSIKKGNVSEWTVSDDEGNVNDDVEEGRQRGARKDLPTKNSIGRVSSSIKKGKASARRLHGTPFKVNKTTE